MTYFLGRYVHHDERSRMFALRHNNADIGSVDWDLYAPILDQGQVGSCTGNALAQWLNTTRGHRARLHVRRGRYLKESDAVELYTYATELDDVPGEYPAVDTGSSGLGVCRAGVRAGYLMGYLHAFGFPHFLQAVLQGPVIVGTDWHEDMYQPDEHGVVRATGTVVGGHEYLVVGLDAPRRLVLCVNSWGEGWGRRGRFAIPFGDFEALLAARGDVTIPVSW